MDDILDYAQYGNCVYKPCLTWERNAVRDEMIVYIKADHTAELSKDLKYDHLVDDSTRNGITSIIKEFWDSFAKEGAKRPILG